jgi:hypothetical protein
MNTVTSIVLHTAKPLERCFFNYIGYVASYYMFNVSYELEKVECIVPCPQNNK